MNKNLITFKSHVDNKIFRSNLNSILDQTKNLKNFDFLVLLDTTNQKFKNIDTPTLEFNKETKICGRSNYDFWYRADIPLIYAYERFPNYNFYYQIEYDCHSGEWTKFFELLDNDYSDFISSWVKDTAKEPSWGWWTKQNLNVSEGKLVGCYFPIIRVSKQACNILNNYYTNGADGFCEILTSTILNIENLEIKDITDVCGYISINHKNENLLRYYM